VLLAFRDFGLLETDPARRGLEWLAASRGPDGGWGGSGLSGSSDAEGIVSGVEETAVAVEALLAAHDDPSVRPVVEQGLSWLARAVEEGRHRQTAPIGFYFAKLWYYERLYPLSFTVSALGEAVRRLNGESQATAASGAKTSSQ
jgi:squalene-hopene/tetraprenyl-beta-curcumene cyclase